MANLIGNLLSNANALNVQKLGVETAGQNISKANDPSYARQRVLFRDGGNFKSGTRVQSRGIEALGIEHIRNQAIDNQITREQMQTSSFEEQQKLLSQLEASINDIIDRENPVDTLDGNKSENADSDGIASALDDFLNTFAELASEPGSEPIRETLFERAQVLVDQFNLASDRLQDLEEGIGDRIDQQVQDTNDVLGEIAELNRKIARTETQEDQMAPDLRDQRQESLEELAEFIDFETDTSGANPKMIDIQVRNTTGNGQDNFSTLVSGGNVNGELEFEEFNENDDPVNRILFREANGDQAIPLRINGGSINGALNVKTNNLVKLQSDFDTLASSVVANVNTAYQGDPPNPDNLFFDPENNAAADISFDESLFTTETINGEQNTFLDIENLQVTNSPNGGNELAKAVGDLVGEKTIGTNAADPDTGSTFRQFIARFSSRVGSEVESANSNVENQEKVNEFLSRQRESISGVSIDEEMTDVLRFQRAFQGTSRVISTLDQMLQQVVAGLIR